MKTYKDFDGKIWEITTILIIFIMVIFIVLQLFSEETASLIKDLLSVASTVFAALVALYIFKGWLIQKRLEILSEKSKNDLLEFPCLYLDMMNFFLLVSDLYNRLELYKEHKNSNLLVSIEQLSNDLYKHEFLKVVVNFNNLNSELMSLIPENDLKILNEISEDMTLLKKYIFGQKALTIETYQNSNFQKNKSNFEILEKKMLKNFELLSKKLINYKNYNFEK